MRKSQTTSDERGGDGAAPAGAVTCETGAAIASSWCLMRAQRASDGRWTGWAAG